MIKNPNQDIGWQTFILKFSFSSKNSKGLSYNQIIGIDFPNYLLINQLLLNGGLDDSFTCELKDSLNYTF